MSASSPVVAPKRMAHASNLFVIPELLECILLNLDMHTLLISGRVCRLWNSLIKTSPKIQTALFFTPLSKPAPGQPRIKNQLIIDIIWPQFIARRLKTRQRPAYRGAWFPDIRKEEAYLRPEASWRRMFLHQPPTSRACFIEGPDTMKGPLYSYVTWGSHDDPIRLKDLEHLIDSGVIVPERPYVFVFGTRGHDFWLHEHAFPGDSQMGINRQLAACEFIIFSLDGTFDEWLEKNNPQPQRCTKLRRLWTKDTKREQNKLSRHYRQVQWEKEFELRLETYSKADLFDLARVMPEEEEEDSSEEDSEGSGDESVSLPWTD
ncbi:hypothetical protein BO78DRAFT_320450 [Aspergillus sclerotiicarbonarius CBS 121057]|uniref:F-box domain-containing protein n=1 Tax=Aspergillus sclerotiicarbonarius (strain CBS 121057 / IBT 28362) TaxID=1448318 RepID=A0A319E4X7_ASPSB|nr:hypothetical protein BO78DRAFT_320450 [Aspergillus sclerotiicarbonarius CBS 121057]